MAVDSATDLVNVLRAGRLLPASQLDELGRDLQGRFPEAKALGRALIEKQWLTPYQVNLLLQGAADKLVLGPYVILERLGDNPLGQVYKARHQLMNRLVMLTVVREELLNQPRAVEQFYQEIQANSQLSDPHLIHAYDAGPIGQTHFFATEYVDGIDLERLVAQAGRLPVATACSFIRQVALGLQHACERGLLHHDLRPANVLVARAAAGGSVSITARTPAPSQTQLRAATIKIANLGLSLLQPRLRAAQARGDGTLDFVAPEQAQGQPMDSRANLYSLGCLFYYLLAGNVPFPGGTNIEKLVRHQMDQPKPIDQLRNDVPGPVRAILQKMMAKRPEDRIQSCGEVAQALQPFCEASAAALRRVAGAPATPGAGGGRTESVTVKLSSTFAALRGLFVDPQTHQLRRIGLVIVAAVVLGLLGMFSVILALVATVGSATTPSTNLTGAGKQSVRSNTPATGKSPVPRVALESPIRYLPENVNNVWVFRMPEIVQSNAFRSNENVIKANLSGFYLMLQPMGIDLYTDVDRLTYIVQQSATSVDVFVLAQGKFDGVRYQEAVDRSRPRIRARPIPNKSPPAFYHEWPAAPGETSPSFTALVNANTFLFASDQRLLLSTLQRSGTPRGNLLTDKDVQHQLENIDAKPSMYLMVGGTLSDRMGTTLLDAGLRLVTVGFRPGDELLGEFTMVARDDAAVHSYRTNAVPFFRDFLTRIDSSGTLSAALAGLTPTVNDATDTLTVRTRYSAADVGRMFKN